MSQGSGFIFYRDFFDFGIFLDILREILFFGIFYSILRLLNFNSNFGGIKNYDRLRVVSVKTT